MSNLNSRLKRIERARLNVGTCPECGRFRGGALPEGANNDDPQFNPRDEDGNFKERCGTCGMRLRFPFAILERGYLDSERTKK